MPEFNKAEDVEQICYQMRLSDFPRGLDRSRIDELFNGFPPYTDQEVQENQIEVNVNFLESTRIAHDARSQFYSAFIKPGKYFTAHTDGGAASKRAEYSKKVTNHINHIMQRSLPYFEKFRSTFALDVLHGVGPGAWPDGDQWCPEPIGMSDVLIPARTYLTMRNLPFFALYRSYTAMELMKLTRGPKMDPGWNMPLVDACLEWIDKETMQLMGSNWPEVWSPEKASERVKGDGGFYVGDQVPTIDCWDFYFYDDSDKEAGWNRRVILDSWAMPQASAGGSLKTLTRKQGAIYNRRTDKGQKGFDSSFLFNPGKRKFASDRSEIVSFQFADLSAVAPFQYHSVRSLGYLLYAVCHLQNRLRGKFTECVFETLMQLFRVKSMDDVQRALKLNLVNKGFIDDTITPVPAGDRWQPNMELVQLGLKELVQIITSNSSSYVQSQNYSQDKVEKTAFQVMAEANATTSLTSVALTQAYRYQEFEYYEILRRFMKKDSSDPEVKKFQAMCLRDKVPEKLLVAEAWQLESERVMGGGNKTLEMAIANQLMEWRDKFDPDPQRKILYDATLALTDDPGRAELLVPDEPVRVTDAVHDAQLAAGTLMLGLPVALKTGMNHIEYVETLLVDMALLIQKATQQGNMMSPNDLTGLQNMAQHIGQHLQIMAKDEQQKQMVKELGGKLSKLMNLLKGFAQRLQQQMKSQQGNGQGGNGDAQKEMVKIQSAMALAKIKQQNTRESHAQRTAQRQIQFEQQLKQEAQKHQMEVQAEDLKTAAEIQRNRLKSLNEPPSSQ